MSKRNIRTILIILAWILFILLFIWLWIEDGKMLEAERRALIETGERQ